jgi:hypothetical protein
MSDNLIDSVAPQLAAPVTREPVRAASESDGETAVAMPMMMMCIFAADDDD